jgi:hypothetical protein
MRRLLPIVLMLGPWMWAPAQQGTRNRPQASDYPAHTQAGELAIGAEYLVHSFSGKQSTYVARDHLVVEVGLFPSKEVMISTGHFTLKVNGKKELLFSQSPQFVAAALKWDDWENRRQVQGGVGVGDASIGVGPRWEPRFPGDPSRRPLPKPPKAPTQDPAADMREEREKPEEVVIETALTEGPSAYPVAGYLYFPFKGKPKSIRSLELIYNGPAGKSTLKLI